MKVWEGCCSAGQLGAVRRLGRAGWAAALAARAMDCRAPVMLERAKAEALSALPAAFCRATGDLFVQACMTWAAGAGLCHSEVVNVRGRKEQLPRMPCLV